MGANEAQQQLQQLMQQLQSGQFAQNSMNQLGQAGLGASNPQQFYGAPIDEQFLRQAVMNKVLGSYGYGGGAQNQYQGIGNPMSVFQGMYDKDPYSGGMMGVGDRKWQQAGFDSRSDWKHAGKPIGMQGEPSGIKQPFGQEEFGWNPSGGNQVGVGQGMPGRISDAGFNPMQTMGNGGQYGMPYQDVNGGGFQAPNSPDYANQMMQNYNPQVSALDTDYGAMISNAFKAAYGESMPSSSMSPQNINAAMNEQNGGTGGGRNSQVNINPQLDQIYNAGAEKINLDYNQQSNKQLEQLFGRGMNASTSGADLMGRLNYGKAEALGGLTGSLAQNQLEIQKAMIANAKPGTYGGGSGGGSGTRNIPSFPGVGGQQMATQDITNLLAGQLGNRGSVPLSFEQQMQLADRQLAEQQLGLQGQLGFGGLGVQQGQLGLQGQGLEQDFLSQIMGMGLQRQQGAAGMNQNDLARMQQYLQGNQQMVAGLGSQSAQMEAQKQPFWQQLLMGGLGAAGSFFSGGFSGSGGGG